MQAKLDDLWTRDAMRHPHAPAPSNLDARLWRYMSGRRFRWMVENGRLYMPRLQQLAHNDPREGSMPDAEAAWWKEQIRSANTPEEKAQRQQNFERILGFVERLRQDWFVSCWTQGDSENFAFWRIYGRTESVCGDCGKTIYSTGESVAVTTTFRKLEEHLPAHIDAGVVGYSDYKIAGIDRYNMIEHIMNKRHFYEYEQEVRAVTNLGLVALSEIATAHIESNIVENSYAPPVQVTTLVDEVVLHPECSESFAEEMKSFCSRHGLPAPRLSGLTT